MKKVLLKKRIYTYKDVFRVIALTMAHYLSFYLYFALIFGIHWAIDGQLWCNFNAEQWILIYCLTAGPLVNAITHTIYAEKGLLWVRAAMWIHTFMIIFAAPILLFAF